MTGLRIGLALAALGEAKLALPQLHSLASPQVLKTPFRWSPPPPSGLAIELFIAIWALSAICLVIGYRPKWSALLLATCIGYYIFIDRQLFTNHAFLNALATFLLGLTYENHGKALRFWPLFLIRYQVSVMYLSTGLAKVNSEFLSGDVLRTYMAMPYGILQTQLDSLYPALSWLTVVVELALPFALWIRRAHSVAFATGFAMHATIVLTMHPRPQLSMFALTAVSCYFAFAAAPAATTKA